MRYLSIFLACSIVACTESTAFVPEVRITTFGDSHVDFGIRGDSVVDVSYISQDMLHVGVRSVHAKYSLAGKLQALSDGTLRINAVNHGIAGTTSGDTYRGDKEPNALAKWQGITRFEAEVLGLGGTTWDAGTGKPRIYAYRPSVKDFVYVTIGTMDPTIYIDSASTHNNIRTMAAMWKSAGLPASHFLLSTIPPNVVLKRDFPGKLSALNAIVHKVAEEEGITVIDVYAKTANGEDWIPGATGDGIHGNEGVMDWLAEEIRHKMLELNGMLPTGG